MLRRLLLSLCLLAWAVPFSFAAADEPAKPKEKPAADHGKEAAKPTEPKEEQVETQHIVSINGQKLDYTAVAGTILLRDNEDKPTAAIFYIAYTKRDVRDLSQRPVRATCSSSALSGARPPRRGTHGAPVSSSSAKDSR